MKLALLFARSLGLKKQSEWVKYANGQYPDLPKFPEDIPKYPNDSKYTKQGWISWADWLNTKNFKNSFWPFRKARNFIHSLGLRSLDEWSLYRDGKIKKLGLMPDYIPRSPHEAYKNSGWKGMPDWLGYG